MEAAAGGQGAFRPRPTGERARAAPASQRWSGRPNRWIKERVAEAQKAADDARGARAPGRRGGRRGAAAGGPRRSRRGDRGSAGRGRGGPGDEPRSSSRTPRRSWPRPGGWRDEAAEAARAAAEEAQPPGAAARPARPISRRATPNAQVDGRPSGYASDSEATAKHAARKLERSATNGGLESYNKPELVELAAGIGIEGRTTMSKVELVDAIAKASRTKR